jgi:hypothetical protein
VCFIRCPPSLHLRLLYFCTCSKSGSAGAVDDGTDGDEEQGRLRRLSLALVDISERSSQPTPAAPRHRSSADRPSFLVVRGFRDDYAGAEGLLMVSRRESDSVVYAQ